MGLTLWTMVWPLAVAFIQAKAAQGRGFTFATSNPAAILEANVREVDRTLARSGEDVRSPIRLEPSPVPPQLRANAERSA